jgi:hypothetical protein
MFPCKKGAIPGKTNDIADSMYDIVVNLRYRSHFDIEVFRYR